MDELRIATLGGLHIEHNGAALGELPSRKAEALIVYLACAGRPQEREVLADMLWDSLPPERARANLSVLLTAVRRRLGGYLQTSRLTVGLSADRPIWLDVAELERQLGRLPAPGATQAPLAQADAAPLRASLDLYRGDFLAGFSLSNSYGFEEWARGEQERLRRAVLRARQHLALSFRASGPAEAAIEQAELAAQMDPLQEWAPLLLMELQTGAGRRAAALEAYERHRRALQAELGIMPGEAIQQLYQRVRSGASLAGAGPLRAGARAGLRGAPPQISPFVGREDELFQISARLADPGCRLLTLVGPGGVGKSRLAIQAAAIYCAEAALPGVFVPLAPVAGPEGLAAAVAAALGLQHTGRHGTDEGLLAYLREQELLLLLDNCEHLPAAADLAAAVVAECPGVRILATAHSALGLSAEWLVELPGLRLPPDGPADPEAAAACSALQLFARRAAQIQPGFRLDAQTLPPVTAICRLLDGMPLAIELAATSVRHMSCAQIAEAVTSSLDVLSSELRDLPLRHRSLRAVFEHAWGLLDSGGQAALSALSVFAGGFTRPAAAAVLGLGGPAAREALDGLIDRSLIRRDPDGRYDLHGLVRQYAAERLADSPPAERLAADRHGRYFGELLLREGRRLRTADMPDALAALGAEADNIRAAWERAAAAGDWAWASETLDGLWSYLDLAGLFAEGQERLGRTITRLDGAPGGQALLGRLLARRGALCERLGRYAEGAADLRRSLRLLAATEDRDEQALALTALGRIADRRGHYHTASRLGRAALACANAAGNSWRAAQAVYGMASAAEGLRRYDESRRLAERSLALNRAAGDLRGEGHCLNLVGLAVEMQGDMQTARAYYQQSLAIFARLGNRWEQTIPLSNLGDTLTALGEYKEARRSYVEALRLARALGIIPSMLMNLVKLAQLLARSGEPERAGELLALPLSHPATEQAFRAQAHALLAELNATLAPAALGAAMARGRNRSLAEVVAALS